MRFDEEQAAAREAAHLLRIADEIDAGRANSVRKVHDVLSGLPLDERICALVVASIERRPEVVRVMTSLAAVIGTMAEYASQTECVAVAEVLRDTADFIENRREVATVE